EDDINNTNDDEELLKKQLTWYERIGVDSCLLSRIIIFVVIFTWIVLTMYAAFSA
ncbi:hypothetical protein SAMD00019534_111700, partial [Acytostelium subglobosum LB1]|uniref:hypothetical protein n=1 Tax=Acytostelium subglobosum LB1 TaxID=1410327 RepID=UPI000644CFB0